MRDSVNCDLLSLHNYTSAASEPRFSHTSNTFRYLEFPRILISEITHSQNNNKIHNLRTQHSPKSGFSKLPDYAFRQHRNHIIVNSLFLRMNSPKLMHCEHQQTLKGLGMFWFPLVAYLFGIGTSAECQNLFLIYACGTENRFDSPQWFMEPGIRSFVRPHLCGLADIFDFAP